MESPRSAWNGGLIRGESPHNMGHSEFSFLSMLLHFIAETPPGVEHLKKVVLNTRKGP